MFNTLKYAKMLEEVGFSRDQAETSIKILVDIMEDRLASKEDLKELKDDVHHRFSMLESKIDSKFSEQELKFTMLESKLTIRMGAMFATAIAVLTALQKLV